MTAFTNQYFSYGTLDFRGDCRKIWGNGGFRYGSESGFSF